MSLNDVLDMDTDEFLRWAAAIEELNSRNENHEDLKKISASVNSLKGQRLV